jgi:hypothetical protein
MINMKTVDGLRQRFPDIPWQEEKDALDHENDWNPSVVVDRLLSPASLNHVHLAMRLMASATVRQTMLRNNMTD